MKRAPDGDYRSKIKTVEELHEIIGPRPRERKVVMCHGHFDVVHPGHIRHLLYAKGKGDVLVASLTSDEHIAKGPYRPYVPEDLRAMNLAALMMVDFVVIDREATPIASIRRLQPNLFAKGYEYTDGGIHPDTAEEMAVLEEYGGEMIFTPGDVIYSSSTLIDMAPPKLGIEKLLMLMREEDLSFDDLRAALSALRNHRVHVVGDTIVDSYTRCTMIGGMNKTPTPSVRCEDRTDFVGGAGVVCKHMRAAGAQVVFSTVLGDDALKDFVLKDLAEAGVECRAVVDPTRPTTNKNAFVVDTYRLLKVDTVDNRSISDSILERLAGALKNVPTDAVIFSDFRHGIFNSRTIPRLIEAIPDGTFRVADSQVATRWGNILDFKGFDLITPNEREGRFAMAEQELHVRSLASSLHDAARCKTLILKLGDRGLLTSRSLEHEDFRSAFVIDSFVTKLLDTVGAGDALLAYTTLSMLGTGNEVIASILGALAAAEECEHDGNVPVTPESVSARIDALEKQARYE